MTGGKGGFNLLEGATKTIPKVCRSSMSVGTRGLAITAYGLEFFYGVFNEMTNPGCSLARLTKQGAWCAEVVTKKRISQRAGALVTDAKDLYDTLSKETSSMPEHRALIFELAGLRGWFVKYSAGVKWTADEYTIVDALSKDKQQSRNHLARILGHGRWSISKQDTLVRSAVDKPLIRRSANVGRRT